MMALTLLTLFGLLLIRSRGFSLLNMDEACSTAWHTIHYRMFMDGKMHSEGACAFNAYRNSKNVLSLLQLKNVLINLPQHQMLAEKLSTLPF
jgi:hypothetical protein